MPTNTLIYNKTYYAQNKQKIIAHLGEQRLCEVCNRNYALYKLSRHRKSIKHIKNLEKIK